MKMEAIPLIPKAKVLPNLDAVPLIRELFQEEFQAVLPTKKLSQNILTSLEHLNDYDEDQETFNSVEYFQNLSNRRQNVVNFTDNVLQAYKQHEKSLKEIEHVEEHIFETHAHFFNRKKIILENQTIRDLLTLRRQPVFKALNANYVRKFKLLQGDAGLPPEHELKSDFRVKNFKNWRKRLDSSSQDSLIMRYLNKVPVYPENCKTRPKRAVLYEKKEIIRKPQSIKKKNKNEDGKPQEIFKAEPNVVFFTGYKLGDIYIAEIKVKNIHQKGVQFQLKPTCLDGPFRVMLNERSKMTVSPGLSFYLNVEFTPKSLDNAAEDIVIATEDGNRFLIPLIAYLEPPVLKTHKEINEFTRAKSEKILNSYIECGACFTGDTKVTKLSFRCYRGSGEFFIMSSENWSRSYINTVTVENLLEIPPFRVYPVFFKMEKDEVIDLFVEFVPKTSGTHVENIVIACNNGQIRSLDLIGDAVSWHSFYFTFQDSLLKELSVEEDDDVKVKYYLDFGDTSTNGQVEKVFCVSNNSDMAFDFQWKIREANITSTQEKYLRLSRDQVKIDPESGTFEPNSIWEFLVTVTFNNSDDGNYRMVLSLYVLNLPYQCIEEDDTIIQPTGFVRNLYSQSLYGEEEASALSPELSSLQGTYESLQESIKSYVEYQNKTQTGPRYDFCRTTCIPNPGLCAKPLKKSKTYFNIGDNLDDGDGIGCACRHRPVEPDSNSDSCNSNARDERGNELSALRNEVIWDFVDILVDELELWVNVFPTRVTLEPSVIELNRPLHVSEETIFKNVRIINHNRSVVTCAWLLPSEIRTTKRISDDSARGQTSFALLFDKQGGNKSQKSPEASENSKQRRPEKSEQDDENKTEMENKDPENLSSVKINVKPRKDFEVGGLSEFTCKIGISPSRAGVIKETLRLSVNEGDLELKVLIFGTVVTKTIEISPDILDFSVLSQGTRYTKDFVITKNISDSLSWRINEFNFDFKKEKFFGRSFLKGPGSVKNTKGVIVKKQKCATEFYCLDARVPGIKCSLLEIEENNERRAASEKQYILVLGDVKIPKLLLSAPRFENAILAPPGKMYVGQKISTKVTLTNAGSVETFFTWGHSFGCHSRKINVEFSPMSCRIEKNNKLTVDIQLTALEEGIINHCYIPCFFCRSTEPLILSIVGMAENVKVTFEIIDYPMQTHANPSTFLRSPFYHTVLRVSWPMKAYNPTLGLNYINEYDIQRMICHCQEVDEEVSRAFGAPKDCVPELETLAKSDLSRKSDLSLKSSEISYEGSGKYYDKKGTSKPKEDLKYSVSNPSSLNSLESKKSEENSALSYNYVQPSLESLGFCKPQLEFLNVPYQTPTLRQFVIRNETSIETSFQITVHTHAMSENLPDRRIVKIKNRVFGYSKDDFQGKLTSEKPLVIIVEPSQGDLKAFDAVPINVYCYGNTWGEYRDSLICEIKGMEAYNLKIFVQIVGHPIYFPMFKTQTLQKPTLRFQALSYIENPVSKQVKVVNRSAIPLSVSWLVFLTKPLLKFEDREESFNLCADSNANFDSTYSGEGSAESSKNYIAKNASERTASFPISNEPTDSGQNSDFFKSLEKSESSLSSPSMKKEKRGFTESEKRMSTTVNEGMNSDLPQYMIPGRPDGNIFKVEPKEMSFEPFEEKKMSVTFDPHFYKPDMFPEEFQGVLTCCVKLKPEDEKCHKLYYRPCGIKFASELMDLNALVEMPLLSFELLRGDMKFTVDANAIVKSEQKSLTMLRKFTIRNQNQKLLCFTIEVSPGLMFKVTHVNTLDKFYPKYNPAIHNLKIDSGHHLEIELECTVTYKDILYAYEELKRKRKQDQCQMPFEELKPLSKSSNECDEEPQMKKEPWMHHTDEFFDQNLNERCSLGPRDSFELNLNRMSSKSDYSCCDNFDDVEVEGEFMELLKMQERPCRPKPPRHVTVIQEEISFIQSGLATQSLLAQLHISFPAIKISQKTLDFGNVFLGETAVRYCSFINLTGFPTDFRVMARINSGEFVASPLTGRLPSANYNSNIGKTITIEFKPSQPGYFKELYHVYCNLDLEFDFYELFVSGLGTWNEKYKTPKFETYTKLHGIYPDLKK